MREIAGKVREELAAGRRVQVGRVVDFKGFGGRTAGEALAVLQDGTASGSLLGGVAEAAVAKSISAASRSVLLELGVGDAEAVAAGLACGGVATVLASDAAAIPGELWASLEDGVPVALVTRPDGGAGPSSLVLVDSPASRTVEQHGSLGDVASDEEAAQAGRQALRLGRDSTRIELQGSSRIVVEAYFPSTTLVVVGEGHLAEALAAAGRFARLVVGHRECLARRRRRANSLARAARCARRLVARSRGRRAGAGGWVGDGLLCRRPRLAPHPVGSARAPARARGRRRRHRPHPRAGGARPRRPHAPGDGGRGRRRDPRASLGPIRDEPPGLLGADQRVRAGAGGPATV